MVLLASPMDPGAAWSTTSLAHLLVVVGVLVVREMQRRRGVFVRTRPLRFARVVLYSVGVCQLANAVALHEPWVAVLGLGAYSLLGFGFFAALLSELIRPDVE